MSENSSSAITDLLFVYGTLKRGNTNAYAAHLHHRSTYIGTGWFPGRLYQIDWFPGAVYDALLQTRVRGDVFQLRQVTSTLDYLDAYEGVDDRPPMYSRRLVPVHLADRMVICQTYLYEFSTNGLVPIESGDFRALA